MRGKLRVCRLERKRFKHAGSRASAASTPACDHGRPRGDDMARIEAKLQAMGLVLPPPLKVPDGVVLPFRFVRVSGRRAWIAGHGPQAPDGSVAKPVGKVG